jgi:hypothetical protein
MKKVIIPCAVATEFFLDAETNGLGGQVFAIHADVYSADGQKIAEFTGKCPIKGEVNPWVAENVLPNLVDMTETHISEDALLSDFANFHNEFRFADDKVDAPVWERKTTKFWAHMPAPVETNAVYDRMVEKNFLGAFDRPYGWFTAETALELVGENPSSVDGYAKKFGVVVPFEGATHHPGYDCAVAKAVVDHIRSRIKVL